jgi:hypothetical protein
LFSIAHQKLEDLIIMIKRYQNKFVGSQYPTGDSVQVEALEQESMQHLLTFMQRAMSLLDLVSMLTDAALKKVKVVGIH